MGGYSERILNITLTTAQTKQTRALVHLELSCWVGPDLPAAPAPLLAAASHVLELFSQQRSPTKPVLLHCRDGGNKSGTFAAVVAALAV